MRRFNAITAAALLAVAMFAPSAASADVCYSVGVTINGDAVVDEADCIES